MSLPFPVLDGFSEAGGHFVGLANGLEILAIVLLIFYGL